MPIYNQLFFKESALAHQLLDGMKGLEIGGGRHNQWGLDVVNCDKFAPGSEQYEMYAKAQRDLCGEVMPVDIVAPGDNIPVPDKSFDFVISSHVIEHFFDPIKALNEWARIARKYIYIVCPHGGEFAALESDRGKLLTGMEELRARHRGEIPDPGTDEHHSRWTVGTFLEMCAALGYRVAYWQPIDDKVGNGFTVVIEMQPMQFNFDLPKNIKAQPSPLIGVADSLERIEKLLMPKTRKK